MYKVSTDPPLVFMALWNLFMSLVPPPPTWDSQESKAHNFIGYASILMNYSYTAVSRPISEQKDRSMTRPLTVQPLPSRLCKPVAKRPVYIMPCENSFLSDALRAHRSIDQGKGRGQLVATIASI